jgi:phage repressor protein C with HTH and peptisase S24 domain
LQKYEADKRVPDADFILKVCDAFHVSERWLLRGLGPDLTESATIEEAEELLLATEGLPLDVGLVGVPFYDVRAGAGAQQIANDERPSKQIVLPQELFLLRGIRPQGSKLMLCSGTSMEPTISDGDLILLDAPETTKSDGIFVVSRAAGVLVKRLQWRSDGSLTLISDNKAYDPEIIARDDSGGLRILGRVRMVFRSV